MTDLKLTEDNFPANFRNEIEDDSGNSVTLRTSVSSKEELETWLDEFRLKSGTGWIFRTSRGRSRYYYCQFSSYRKVKSVKRDVSKDCNCLAKLRVTLFKETKHTKKSRKGKKNYVKAGLLCQIKIDLKHSHTVKTADSLRYLRPVKETSEAFRVSFYLSCHISLDLPLTLLPFDLKMGNV